jgi:hypothetical protein
VPVAWSLSLMLKVFLAAIFTFLFMREIGASVSGSIGAAMLFAFGGFMTGWLAWPRADTSIWLPLLCFQIHRLCRRPSRRDAIALAAVLAMPILAGHPAMAARVLTTGAGYSIWILVSQLSQPFSILRRQVLWLAAAGCLAVGLTAVQIGPLIEWLGQIFRTLDMPAGSLLPSQAIGLFSRDFSASPNSAGVYIPDAAAYLGTLTLLAAPFAFFCLRKSNAWFFAIVGAISLCTAYGVAPFPELSLMLPVFRGIRFDELLMLAGFSLAVLAGLGISYLETAEWKSSRKTEWAAAAGILILTTAVFHKTADVLSKMTQPGVDWWHSPRSFRVLLVAAAIVISLRLLQLLSRRQWIVMVTLLITVDLVSYRYGHIPFNRVETIYPDVPLFDFLSKQPKPFRVVSLNGATPLNAEYVYGLSTASGYEYMLKRMSSLSASLLEEPPNGYSLTFTSRGILESKNRILDLLNIRYLIATKFNESEAMMRSRPNRFREVWSDGNTTVFENLTFLPRAFLVPQTNIEAIPSEEAQLARLEDSTFDPEHQVILPNDVELSNAEETSEADAVVKYSEGLNWVRLEVNAATPSVLVLAQIYYPGWKVYVDGKRAPLMRPDYAFTGTTVNSGAHVVEFRFLPASFILGSVISAASLLVAVVAYWKRL